MGSGASLLKERHAHVYKKESSRFHSSVKSDLDKGIMFLKDVSQFLRDETKELKDTQELRRMLRGGCDKLSTLLNTFKTDEVFDVLERVAVQEKIDKDTAGLHSIIHGFAGIHSASRRRLSVKTPMSKKKKLIKPDLSAITLKKIMTLPPQKPAAFKLDRMKSVRRVDMAKSQHGFIDFIVRPSFEAWGEYVHEMRDVFLTNLNENSAIDWADFMPLKRGEWESTREADLSGGMVAIVE